MYIRADEYCERVFDGTHDSPKPKDVGRLLITSKNILNQELNFKDAYLISPEEFDKVNKRSQIHQWDILFSMIGTVGSIYLERNSEIDYCIKNMGVFSCGDKDRAEWLYYYLQSDEVKKRINAFISGAVQKFVPLQFLRNLPVPEYDESKRNVSFILSSIDRRIENLRAQNRVLEQTAKTIYDYTFLQCAGHQTTYNKTLNRNIPTNWDVKKMEEVLLPIERGISYSSEEIKSGKGMPMYNLACFDKQGNYRSGELKFYSGEYKKSDLIKLGDMLIACTDLTRNADIIGTPVIVNDEYDSFVFTTDLAKITPKNEDMKYHIYFWLKNSSYRKYIKPFASGTNVLHLNVRGVLDYPILVPDSSVLKKFNAQVEPVFKKQLVNSKQIKALTTQRNTLLPLLMTGQVEM